MLPRHTTDPATAAATAPPRSAPMHLGSPAGELAACMRGAGIADRSDLAVLRVNGRPASLSDLIEPVTSVVMGIGGVVATPIAWWCRESNDSLLAITEQRQRARLLAALRAPGRRLHGVEVTDLSAEMTVTALVGARSTSILAALGALGADGDPRAVPPFSRATVDGSQVLVLLQSDRRALLIVPAADGERVRRAARAVGEPFGLTAVGTDAVTRFALHERVHAAQAGPVHGC